MPYRGDLTNEQWAKLAPLLPPQKPATGTPNNDHRGIINGMLWKLRTGAPWRDLPERYGPWSTVYSPSDAGAWPGSGTGSSPPCRRRGTRPGSWIGRSTSSMGPSSGRTSTRPGQRGGAGRRGARTQPGGLQHEGAPPGRGGRQAADPGADAGAAPRGHRLRGAHGVGGGQAARPRPPAAPARPGGRGQGLQQPVRRPVRRRGIRYTIPRRRTGAAPGRSTGPSTACGIASRI